MIECDNVDVVFGFNLDCFVCYCGILFDGVFLGCRENCVVIV